MGDGSLGPALWLQSREEGGVGAVLSAGDVWSVAVRGKASSFVPDLEVSMTYDLENLGCPGPSCVQMCARSSKAQGL